MSPSQTLTLVDQLGDAEKDFATAVLSGLAQSQKTIPARFFYDQRGSELFEQITQLPEYYPTRTEMALFETYGAQMGAALGEGVVLVEPGSGSSAKTPALLKHLKNPAAYVPVDISDEFLRISAAALAAQFPGLAVLPVAADFTRGFALPKAIEDLPHAGFFPGSTLGNFEPQAAAKFLDTLGTILGEDAGLLIGIDTKKDRRILEQAYDDSQGVTAAFNLNLLTRINRELAGEFDLDGFQHKAIYNAKLGRIEMHLVSQHAQSVTVLGRTFTFAAKETIHTENSYKYKVEEFKLLARVAGWHAEQVWLDDCELFSVHLLRRGAAKFAP